LDMEQEHELFEEWGFCSDATAPHLLVLLDHCVPSLHLSKGTFHSVASMIVNYELPTNIKDYMLRVGRMDDEPARKVVNFLVPRDVQMLRLIEQRYHTMIEELE